MCGVALAYYRKDLNFDPRFKTALENSVRARGIDEYTEFTFQSINHYFGRLAIRALTSGHQPFSFQNHFYTSSINGELYNQIELEEFLMERGSEKDSLPEGDMQLLGYAIAHFGPSILNFARGMYAGYVVNNETRQVICFRDRIGEKPLYILNSSDLLVISSTPLIAKLNRDDNAQLQNALLFGMFGDEANIGGWNELKPGSYVEIEIENYSPLNVRNYWSWPKEIQVHAKEFEGHFLESLIRNAVRRQLVSDVPICTLMSGGIDSALITKFAQDEIGMPIDSFTLDFSDTGYSEIDFTRQTSMKIGNRLHVISQSPKQLSTLIDECLKAMPVPIFDTACLSLFALTKYLPPEFKVALTGDGGDELFGGYELLKYENLLALIRRLPQFIRILVADILSARINSSQNYLDINTRLSRASDVIRYKQLSIPQIALSPLAGTPLFTKLMKRTVDDNLNDQAVVLDYYRDRVLPGIYLQKSDRMGLANGVEIRAPLLDTILIEEALSNQNIHQYSKKKLLRSITSDFIPWSVFGARKHGFSAPMCKILENYPEPNWRLEKIGFSSAELEIIWGGALEGKENFGIAAWALLVVQEFVSRFEN